LDRKVFAHMSDIHCVITIRRAGAVCATFRECPSTWQFARLGAPSDPLLTAPDGTSAGCSPRAAWHPRATRRLWDRGVGDTPAACRAAAPNPAARARARRHWTAGVRPRRARLRPRPPLSSRSHDWHRLSLPPSLLLPGFLNGRSSLCGAVPFSLGTPSPPPSAIPPPRGLGAAAPPLPPSPPCGGHHAGSAPHCRWGRREAPSWPTAQAPSARRFAGRGGRRRVCALPGGCRR